MAPPTVGRSRSRWACIVATGLLLAACGGEPEVAVGQSGALDADRSQADAIDSPDVAMPDPPKTTAAARSLWIDHWITPLCEVWHACGYPARPEIGIDSAYSSVASCVEKQVKGRFSRVDKMAALLKSGELVLDVAAATACWKKHRACPASGAVTCDPPILAGTIANGAACTDHSTCKAGVCKGHLAHVCGGTCAPEVPAGGACTDLDFCVDGHTCSGGTCKPMGDTFGKSCIGPGTCGSTLVCHHKAPAEKGTCGAPLAKGAACVHSSFQCGPTRYCTYTKGLTGTCEDRIGDGQPCPKASRRTCKPGLACIRPLDKPKATPVCKPVVAVGETCTGIGQCNAQDLWCKAKPGAKTGQCALLPGENEACAPPTGSHHAAVRIAECRPGLECKDDGVCRPWGDIGEACETSWNCQPGLQCLAEKCAKPLAPGAACGGEKLDPCGPAATCKGGKCVSAC